MDPSTTEPAARWMTEFHSFTPVHYITVMILATLMVGASWLGRRWTLASPTNEWRLRAIWAWSIFAFQAFAITWYAIPWDPSLSVPLQVCDLVVLIAPVALLTNWRLARTILYFWGIGLSTQAYFTPVLEQGVGTVRFWLFWVSHTQIVGSAIYMVAVLHYRPKLRDLRNIALFSLAYLAFVMVINITFDTNYGYVGDSQPGRPTLLDKLGEWPLRVVYLVAIVNVVFVIVWAPWAALRRPERAGETDAD